MCIIVDANKLGDVLATEPNADAAPVRGWLDRPGAGTLVYSTAGKFSCELGHNARQKLQAYVQAGRARQISADELVPHETELRSKRLRSDDPHVLALALASGARLLYTGDAKLVAAFTSSDLVKRPRGKVYSGAGNADLLSRRACAKPT